MRRQIRDVLATLPLLQRPAALLAMLVVLPVVVIGEVAGRRHGGRHNPSAHLPLTAGDLLELDVEHATVAGLDITAARPGPDSRGATPASVLARFCLDGPITVNETGAAGGARRVVSRSPQMALTLPAADAPTLQRWAEGRATLTGRLSSVLTDNHGQRRWRLDLLELTDGVDALTYSAARRADRPVPPERW